MKNSYSQKELVRAYLEELSELETIHDFDLVFDLAKSYQDSYPHLPTLYAACVASVLKGK